MIPLASSRVPAPVALAFFVALAVFIIVGLLNNGSRRHKAMLRRLAARLGGTFVDGGWLGEPGIHFAFGGREARLTFFGGSRGSPPNSRVMVDLRGQYPGSLHILKDGFGQSFLKLFGAQDLLIGDAAFDKDYVIKASPPALATRLFSPERRAAVIRTVRRLGGFADPSFDVDPGSLSVVVRQYLREEQDLLALIESAREFLGFLVAPLPTPGIELGDVVLDGRGNCPVCGTGLRGEVLHCTVCAAPQHEECWAYLGRCAAYGCRGTRGRAS